MNIPIKDREEKVEMFRIALATADIGIDYKHVDLILKVYKAYEVKGGNFTIKDAAEIKFLWEDKWKTYEIVQNNKKAMKK